ncbi:D-alanine--D-alanine ligase [Clostridium acetireducens DSM 10703]|jgi:D-alanine-D-alanine ligase|uniref:D-alanine--D-alanine ligase n=1 Tax=Clostridium acetireducens DSM 10703 TaxID=1121290 RepID=A0A1E8EW69_9CLOT|nr:D-alanine--D-alanine ligase [Clostridium acetireducens]OFI01511.1 D-alanine--D-alanine ligase [Clostridium acetireducens DSM 10703]
MKIGVIMGGISSEREISLNSGKEVVKYLNKDKYEVIPIIIDKKEDIIKKAKDIDFAFLALHGKFGEDGTIQSVLETLNIPYSGCDMLTSAICMDKDITKKILEFEKINTAKWVSVKSVEEINYEVLDEIGYPFFIKPNSGGSSVATNMISKREEVEDAVIKALEVDKEVMIEKYIKGEEITCCILNRKMLPVIAIKPKSAFFDYTAKYTKEASEEVIVELEENLHKKVEEMSIKCWDALKCRVYVRVDMIISNGKPYVLELNTLPGMTSNSLFPKSAASIGMSFSELLDKIIEYSLKCF